MSTHTALIVEDDDGMAATLRSRLTSFGHHYVHARNQQEAEKLIREREFCYVLLDLQIPVDSECILPQVEYGQNLLEHIRGLYPGRPDDEGNWHHLPVLVLSGHSEHSYVVRALQDGANDFLKKPIDDNRPTFRDKVSDALRHSGRHDHKDCSLVQQRAKLRLVEGPARCVAGHTVVVTGQAKRTSIKVLVNGIEHWLAPQSLALIMRMAIGYRSSADEGWVHKHDLGARDDQGFKAVSRLRKHLGGPAVETLIENDGHGRYRLAPSAQVEVDVAGLLELDEKWIRDLAGEYRRVAGGGAPKAKASR